MSYLNLAKTGSATIDLLPIRAVQSWSSKTAEKAVRASSGLNEPFTERYFEKLVSAVSSSHLEKIDQSLISTGEQLNILMAFGVDIVQPEDHVNVMLFEREKSVFIRLLPTLMQRHEGQFVAVHDGVVVDSDRSSSELVRRFFGRFGDTHVYIGYVGQEEPISYSVSPFNF